METDTLQNLLKIYKDLYTYKHLLKDSPALTIDVSILTPDEVLPLLPTIQQQTGDVIAYLLGLKELPDIPTMSARIDQYYQKDNFWRKLLLAYVDVCKALEDETAQQMADTQKAIDAQRMEIFSEIKDLSDTVGAYIQQRKDIVARFSAKLDAQKFPIDSKQLFTNYLNMAEKDPKNAWQLLITSPAAFAPLKTVDAVTGKVLVPPMLALKINRKIARFIKSLKA